MVMGEVPDSVDVAVVGAGPGGYEAALEAAGLGRQVVLIEREAVGGTCLNVGCIPSKMLIERANSYELLRQFDTHCEVPKSLSDWQKRRELTISKLRGDIHTLLSQAGVRIIEGLARFTGRSRLAVAGNSGDTRFLEFRHAILAVGSRPRLPNNLPAEDARIMDSTAALALREIPDRLAVVGAGYIGVELATAFAKLGSEVAIVEMQDRVLPEMPGFVSQPVDKRLRELGIGIHLDTSIEGFDDDGIHCITKGMRATLACNQVLVATGRIPNTDDIGLDSAMIRTDRDGFISVGEDRIIPGTTIAAIGDITQGPMLAHKASAEAVVAAHAICGKPTGFDPAAIPLIIFSDPEIACAGETEDSAKALGNHSSNHHHTAICIRSSSDDGKIVGVHTPCS